MVTRQGLQRQEHRSASDVLRSVFGYERFRGEQAEIVSHVIGGGDALVLMPTGGGKSLCYQIPALVRSGVGVVVSPLIALMKDQVDALAQLGVRAAYLNSSLSPIEARAVEERLAHGSLDLIYVAPERLLTARFLALLEHAQLALFAIDEAHCVSQWGHDFRPEYLGLSLLADRFPAVPRLALTATADEATRREMAERLRLREARTFISSFDRPNIRYTVVAKENAREQFAAFYGAEHRGDAGIVYCLSRKSVDTTAAWLQKNEVAALPYHAGLDAATRQRHQERFLREEGVVMVATIAFGMGIDKPDVRFVAHLDLPKSLEGYYQETGRAGRDGLPASAFMTYGLGDVVSLRRMVAGSTAPEAVKRVENAKLEALLGYCESPRCRRQVLLGYFGETLAFACGNCDTCLAPLETWDGTVAAQKALSNVYRTGQRFGAAHLIDVLLGKSTERVRTLGHHSLSTYGVGKEHGDTTWRSVIRQLVAGGYLTTDAGGHGSLLLTPRSKAVLKGEERIRFRRDPVPRKGAPGTAKRAPATPLAGAELELWEALRARRGDLAREQGVPPYVIFHDSTLRQMVGERPRTPAQLARISGVGGAKLQRYGGAFLEVLAAHAPAMPANPERDAPAHDAPAHDFSASDTVGETKDLLFAGLSPEQVAAKRSLKVSTILGHCAELVRRGDLTVAEATRLPESELQHIESAFHALAEDERSRLKPLFEALGGKYDYNLLRCVLAGFTE